MPCPFIACSIKVLCTSLFCVVFSTAPRKYAVVESKGFIKAQCCVDMSVTIVIVYLLVEFVGVVGKVVLRPSMEEGRGGGHRSSYGGSHCTKAPKGL